MVEYQEKQIKDKHAQIMFKNVRLNFVSLAKPFTLFNTPNVNNEVVEGVYTVTCLIPKKEGKAIHQELSKTVKSLCDNTSMFTRKQDRDKAYKTATAINKPGSLLKDGDYQVSSKTGLTYDGCSGHYMLRAKTKAYKNENGEFVAKIPLELVSANGQRVSSEDLSTEFYSGVWGSVVCNLRPYVAGSNIGVSIYLNGVQKLKDDDPLGGVKLFGDESANLQED